MNTPTIGHLLRNLGSGSGGYVLALSVGLVLGCALIRFGLATWLLKHFRHLGPVRPELFDSLKNDWDTRNVPFEFLAWFQRVGNFLAIAVLILGFFTLAVEVMNLGAIDAPTNSWKLLFLSRVMHIKLAVVAVLFNFGVHVVLGGLANLIYTRARSYVRAGESLPSRAELRRIESIIDSVDEDLDS
jgi:hypothetical protein